MKRERVLFPLLLSVLTTSLAMPAHAVPITVDSADRAIQITGPNISGKEGTSSLGLFSESVAGSFSTSDYQLSVTASQASNISLLSNSLIVTAVGLASVVAVPDNLNCCNAGALSNVNLTFTLNDWASVDVNLSVSGPTLIFTAAGLTNLDTNQAIFSPGGLASGSYSGLLSPGRYQYLILDTMLLSFPDHSTSVAYASSLVVQNSPEPSSSLLLACGLALMVVRRLLKTFAGIFGCD
jgi:hypothetical protein